MLIKVVRVLEVKSIVLLVCVCYHQNHSASHFDNVPICFLLPSLRYSHLLRQEEMEAIEVLILA